MRHHRIRVLVTLLGAAFIGLVALAAWLRGW
jgi:hypothetical protein